MTTLDRWGWALWACSIMFFLLALLFALFMGVRLVRGGEDIFYALLMIGAVLQVGFLVIGAVKWVRGA